MPDARNRGRQQHCRAPACRRASKAASQARWRAKPDNADYFKGAAHVERVRVWRKAHPGYWQRSPRRSAPPLQDTLIAQPPDPPLDVAPDAAPLQGPLQEPLMGQHPLWVGLVAHLTGMTLQEDIATMTRRLHSRGQAVLGIEVPRPTYEHDSQTTPRSHATPTGAAFV